MRWRLSAASGSTWLYLGLLLGVFSLAAISGYVYQYEPSRDRVVLLVDRDAPPSDVRIVTGTVLEASGGTLVLDRAGERVELTIPPGTPVEDLRRADGPLVTGSTVNVGAQQTDFGLVLTGVVALEDGRVEAGP